MASEAVRALGLSALQLLWVEIPLCCEQFQVFVEVENVCAHPPHIHLSVFASAFLSYLLWYDGGEVTVPLRYTSGPQGPS